MTAVALILVALGVILIISAVRNQKPKDMVQAIITTGKTR